MAPAVSVPNAVPHKYAAWRNLRERCLKMPLPKPEPRTMLHVRDIQLRGYERDDGLVDIEAHMTDIKTYSINNRDRGGIGAGEPVHDMWLRISLSRDMTIQACIAAMDGTPHNICSGVAANYQRLVGLNIGKGFIKAAIQRLGGIEGCTHLREMLQPLGTVALQTMMKFKKREPAPAKPQINPNLLNSCYAYNENGTLVAGLKAEAAAN